MSTVQIYLKDGKRCEFQYNIADILIKSIKNEREMMQWEEETEREKVMCRRNKNKNKNNKKLTSISVIVLPKYWHTDICPLQLPKYFPHDSQISAR